ncbi:MAG: hypothetical protein ACLFSU_06020, partial [Acholeplasmataceae bacterium]
MVSIIMTVVTLWLVSLITVRWFFTPDSLVSFIQNVSGGLIPSDFEQYLTDPRFSGVVVSLVDLVVRIVAFFLLYPIVKWLLTLIIFRTFWQRYILPGLLARQDRKKQEEMRNKPFEERYSLLPSRTYDKNLLGRLFGGVFGAVRGLLVAFVLLLPVFVLASFTETPQSGTDLEQQGEMMTITVGDQEIEVNGNDYEEIFDSIDEVNESGMSSAVSGFEIGGKTVDRLLFDMVFTTTIVEEDETKRDVNYGNEFEGLIGIASVLAKNGYLDSDFDVESISADNLDDIEYVFDQLGDSELIDYMIPVGTEYGVTELLPDMLDGTDLYEREKSADALERFEEIDWNDEFDRLYDVVAEVLEFGSVGDLLDYAENTELLFELSREEGQALADVLRALGDSETLVLLNAALDYATTLEEAKELIEWMPPEEVEAYLQDRLDFAISDLEYFIGDTGEMQNIARLVETFYSDEYGDIDLVTLFENIDDPETLLDEDNGEWLGALIENLADIQLVVEAIPIGVDYAFYELLSDDFEEELADSIIEALADVEWGDEIDNVADIYKEAVKLGLTGLFGDDPDYYGLIDEVVDNQSDAVRTIAEKIFEDSQVVNTVLELAAPTLVEIILEDEELIELANEALMSDPESGEVDFNFGQEFNTVLDIADSAYEFTTISEIIDISDMTTDAIVDLAIRFGELPQYELNDMTSSIADLQIVDRIGASGLEYARDEFGLEEFLYVPDDVDLGQEMKTVLELAHYAAGYLGEEYERVDFYEYVDFAGLLADPAFRDYLLDTPANKNSELLTQSVAHIVKTLSEDQELIFLPPELEGADPDSAAWETEVDALLEAVLDLGASTELMPNVTLSLDYISTLLDDPDDLNLDVLSDLAEPGVAEAAFERFDDSSIFSYSAPKAIDDLGTATEDIITGYAVRTPELALDGDELKDGALVELVSGL